MAVPRPVVLAGGRGQEGEKIHPIRGVHFVGHTYCG